MCFYHLSTSTLLPLSSGSALSITGNFTSAASGTVASIVVSTAAIVSAGNSVAAGRALILFSHNQQRRPVLL